VKTLVSCYANVGRGFIVLDTPGRKLRMETTRQFSAKSDLENKLYGIEINSRGDLCKGENLLYQIWQKNRHDPEFLNTKIFRLLRHNDLWIASYFKLLGSNGSNTPGTDNQTIADESFNSIMTIKDTVLNQTFKWGNIRRVYIPKSNGDKRPLGIPNFKDRLVQEVIRRILNSIYDPVFSSRSHGFRPGRSCHTALRHIRKDFKGTKWLIEGDISKFFDKVDHQILDKLLRKKIKDERFLNLIYSGCKAKIILPEGGAIKSELGTPQGGVLSPLLANVYLHELDIKINEIIKDNTRGRQRKHCNDYRRYASKFGRRAARSQGLYPSDPMDPYFRRCSYVRYADDFIVGFIGTYLQAETIREFISCFLAKELSLSLNLEKTQIINFGSKYTSFLGYKIKSHPGVWTKLKSGEIRLTGKGHVVLKTDNMLIIKRLNEKGFCKKDGYPIPKCTFLSDTQAVSNAKINRILMGLAQYYLLADNRRQCMSLIFYILSFSLAKMYAAKFRWHRIATIFKIGGKDLSKPIKIKNGFLGKIFDENKIEGLKYSNFSEIPIGDKRSLNPAFDVSWPIVYKSAQFEMVANIEEILRKHTIAGPIMVTKIPCIVCGTFEDVQIHHVKPLRNIKNKSLKQLIISKAERKVVYLCRKHHLVAHKGSFKPV